MISPPGGSGARVAQACKRDTLRLRNYSSIGRTSAFAMSVIMIMVVTTALGRPRGTNFAPAPAHTTWSVEVGPAPPSGFAFLTSVSCVPNHFCMAVGEYRPSAETLPIRAFSERWNGSTWKRGSVSLPNTQSRAIILSAVSCPTNESCFAAGSIVEGSGSTPLVVRWDGARWSRERTPSVPAAEDGGLYGISCPATTSCVAVGSKLSGQVPLVEKLSGSSWRMSVPGSRGFTASLTSVSCPTETFCIAAGSTNAPRSPSRPYAVVLRATGWMQAALPQLSGGLGQFNSISCRDSAHCFAVGLHSKFGFAAVMSRLKWTFTLEGPPQRDAYEAVPYGASCVKPVMSCVVVGVAAYEAVTTKNVGLLPDVSPTIEHWTLKSTYGEQSYKGSGELFSVSCWSRSCVAVGERFYAVEGLVHASALIEVQN
jgi:hypothetical protein